MRELQKDRRETPKRQQKDIGANPQTRIIKGFDTPNTSLFKSLFVLCNIRLSCVDNLINQLMIFLKTEQKKYIKKQTQKTVYQLYQNPEKPLCEWACGLYSSVPFAVPELYCGVQNEKERL